MKLVYRIILHISWVLSLLLAAWALFFYVTLVDEINDETDDALEHRAEAIIAQQLSGREVASTASGNEGYFLKEVTREYAARLSHERYTDEEIYIPEQDDEEPARVLRTIFRDRDGRWFELTVMTPTFEKDELREAILWWIVWLYLFLLLTILTVNVLVLHRTLRPLRALLRWLDAYTVGGKNPPLACDTNITEFCRLNEAASRYAARAEQLFDRQKQFIGNASHELQTPLAVLGGRMEYMLDHAGLDEQTMGEVIQMQRTLGHIVRLNKTLLLLAKIDNGQFPENTDVDISAMIREQKELYDDIYEERDIRCDMHLTGSFLVRMNESLASVLVSNLIRNAYAHSEAGARIDIRIEGRTLTVSNDGVTPLDGKHIFERFYQGSKREGSTGLGLALVKAVADSYGLCVGYRFGEEQHIFSVEWPQ